MSLRVLRPSDYVNGRPDLSGLAPFVGGTLNQQRAEIRRRRAAWAAADAAAETARVEAFYAARDRRAAAWAARNGPRPAPLTPADTG